MALFAPLALAISGVYVSGLWEGALIAGLVWLCLRALPNLGATTRYIVWLLALTALVIIPAVTVLLPAPQTVAPPSDATPAVQPAIAVATRAMPDIPARLANAEMPATSTHIMVSPVFPVVVVALIWILVACTRGLVLALNLCGLARIKRDARRWSSAHGYPVFLSDRVTVPLAIGFLRPAIILPASLVVQQTSETIDAILIHEAAHLQRYDVWTNAWARILEVFAALNPVAWFVLRRLAMEREIACDDWVVARLGAGDVFARALATMASSAGARAPLGAPSALGSRHCVVARIEALLDARPRRLRLSLSALGGSLMLFALVAIVLQSISPVLAYAPQMAPATQVAVGCTTPNRSISTLVELDRTNSVEKKLVSPVDSSKYVARLGANHLAIVDLTVDSGGVARKVTVVSAPSIPGVTGQIRRRFMALTYEPALRNCVAVASTVRMGAYVGPLGGPGEQTLSVVAPSYPDGWSAAHPTACKVPNLLHTGVPAFPATLRNMAATSTYTSAVRVHVNAGGSVTDAALIRRSGESSLDDAVLAAARAPSYPMTESSGFKPVRPSHTSLAWNLAHGSDVYSKCNPLPSEYVWTTTATRDDSMMVGPIWSSFPGMK